jgi:hypothetical protein
MTAKRLGETAAVRRFQRDVQKAARVLPDTEVLRRVEDIVWASDRKFFRQHPRRQYRVRPAWAIEMEDFRRHGDIPDLRDGLMWWVAVREVRRGWRMRIPFVAPAALPPGDIAEDDALFVWEQVTPDRAQVLATDIKTGAGQ